MWYGSLKSLGNLDINDITNAIPVTNNNNNNTKHTFDAIVCHTHTHTHTHRQTLKKNFDKKNHKKRKKLNFINFVCTYLFGYFHHS